RLVRPIVAFVPVASKVTAPSDVSDPSIWFPAVVSDRAPPVALPVTIVSAPDEWIVRSPDVEVTLFSVTPDVVMSTDEPLAVLPLVLTAVRFVPSLSASTALSATVVWLATVPALSRRRDVSDTLPPVEDKRSEERRGGKE